MSFSFEKIIFSAFIFLLPASLFAQSNPQGMTPLHVAKIEQVREIALSPSGDKVVYTLRVQANPLEKNKPATYDLYLIDLESGSYIPFVTSMNVREIAFRPGHKSITFLSRRSVDHPIALFEISLKGGEARKIFDFPTSIVDYDWAPDGNHLAFMAPDTHKQEESILPYEPLVYEENLIQRRGFIANLAQEGQRPYRVQLEGSIYQMHWSPDGSKLAIAIAPTPLIDDYYMRQQVVIVDHYGQSVLGRVKHEGKLGQIAWSPDGTKLAMLAGADIYDPIAGRLFIVSALGGEPVQLKPNFKGMFEQIQWTDKNTLNYLASKGVWSVYGSINADGSGMQTIIGKGGPNLTNFEKAKDGTIIIKANTPAHPNELYRLTESNALSRLTYSNPWLDSLAFGRQEVVSWKANDETVLQGMLIYPVNFQKGQKYPLITVVHGGPESHYDNGWLTSYFEPGQVGAAQGYFVFYPNYRGSTGRGEVFAKSSQGDPGGAEFDDILAGIDGLIEVGVVDSAKVGVTGGSYGGYATGWFATRYTDRFAAGVMFVGISNNLSKWGTSDIPQELYLVHARKRVWEDYEFFLKRSPVYWAGQAETPLLILAGKEDTRVFPSQSYELYRHIKVRTDTPVRLVLYPGEGHGNRNATARLDYNIRMMRWFNTYLKSETEEKPDTMIEVDAVEADLVK
ncbi:MAG TPA: S9 family peptidase [Balneolaceae bacterium]|nr:S9 family peptidase [Balneolaceae bacterium]